MSTYPSFEARLDALEHRQLNTEVRIESLARNLTSQIKTLSDDMQASFDAQRDYQINQEKEINIRFNTIENAITTLLTVQQEQATTLKEHTTILNQILERLSK